MFDTFGLEKEFPAWHFEKNVSEDIYVNATCDVSVEDEELLKIVKACFSLYGSKNVRLTLTNGFTKEIVVAKNDKHPKKYRRMYTSGCFDIFHFGHLNILEKSKELCDYLLVGVSTDELILKEKGSLPIIPFVERIRVVEAIKYVDEVIPQIDKNKQKIVDKFDIDAISVGDDWRGRFPQTTCVVEYFPYTPNVSSTVLKRTLNLNEKERLK